MHLTFFVNFVDKSEPMNNVITEITPLSDKDCFYLVDRNKTEFNYPLHRHHEFELNYVSNCRGAMRLVGDSIVELGDYDLVLIGPNLEHCWEQNKNDNSVKREITLQFSSEWFSDEFLAKNQMNTIADLFKRASRGVSFGMNTIMKVYDKLDKLTTEQPPFARLINFLEIIYTLSVAVDACVLSTSSFANVAVSSDSRRITRVEQEIDKNYNKDLSLEYLAEIAGMTPTAFSRFFRKRTGRTLTDYIIDIRIGHASRKLVDTTMSISEICYQCGFNNISNFNRAFKRKKKCSPKAFRENYLKTKLIV